MKNTKLKRERRQHRALAICEANYQRCCEMAVKAPNDRTRQDIEKRAAKHYQDITILRDRLGINK